jgi:hypothetical protein
MNNDIKLTGLLKAKNSGVSDTNPETSGRLEAINNLPLKTLCLLKETTLKYK